MAAAFARRKRRRLCWTPALDASSSGRRCSAADGIDREFAAGVATQIGPEQFVAAIDTKAGKIAVRGWREHVEVTPEQAILALEPYCSAFLYTHVDTEGTMSGFPMEIARSLRPLTARQLIVAGGIRNQAEIDALGALGVDAVVGMAVYSGILAT